MRSHGRGRTVLRQKSNRGFGGEKNSFVCLCHSFSGASYCAVRGTHLCLNTFFYRYSPHSLARCQVSHKQTAIRTVLQRASCLNSRVYIQINLVITIFTLERYKLLENATLRQRVWTVSHKCCATGAAYVQHGGLNCDQCQAATSMQYECEPSASRTAIWWPDTSESDLYESLLLL